MSVPIPHDPLNREQALLWLQRALGGGVVRLELCKQHFEDAFADALRWYVGRKGIKRRAMQNVVSGFQEYLMPDDTEEVLEVWFPGVQLDIIAAVNPYAFIDVDQVPVAYQSISGVPGGAFYGTLHQVLAHAETARRIVGSEPAWEFFKDTNTLSLAPRNQRGGIAVVRYISTRICADDPVAPATVPINDFKRLRFMHRDLILKYALAGVKMRLGRVRAKYTDGMPAAGGTKQLDGETLLGEAQNEMEALDEKLSNLNEGTPFLTG